MSFVTTKGQLLGRAQLLMNKVLVLSASIILLSVAAQGVTITLPPANCVPFPATFTNGAGTATVSCPAFTIGGGAVLTSVTMSYIADYQFGSASGTNTVQVTFTPVVSGVTFTPGTATATVTGAVSSGSPGTASAAATAGITNAAFSAAFPVNLASTVTQGTVATSSGAVTVTYDYTAAPPPPPPPTSSCDAVTPIFSDGAALSAFQVRYASNLNVGDSVINITNAGTASTLTGGSGNGNLCVHVYTFSPDEQEISCCSCLVTPNALVSLSAQNDLISNTLTPAKPTSIVVKLVATTATGALAPGLEAWGTTLHAAPGGGVSLTETPFSQSALSAAELNRISALCGFIQSNGSGFGICRGCRLGGLATVIQ